MIKFERGPALPFLDLKPRYLKVALLSLLALALADLATLYVRGRIWPAPPPTGLRPRGPAQALPLSHAPPGWGLIADRNIFNADGVIAEATGSSDGIDERMAVPTSLDLALVATVIHEDPARSLAAFRLKDATGPKVFTTGASIDGLATIVRIRRGRVFIRDTQTRELQYVELPNKEPLISSEFGSGHAGIISEGPGQYSVDRTKFEAETRDLHSLLMQARATPVLSPGGQIDGFRIDALEGGSVFEGLGLRQGDIIRSVNGRKVDSVNTAIELFNSLRGGGSSVQIAVDRGGRSESLSYSLR